MVGRDSSAKASVAACFMTSGVIYRRLAKAGSVTNASIRSLTKICTFEIASQTLPQSAEIGHVRRYWLNGNAEADTCLHADSAARRLCCSLVKLLCSKWEPD